MKKKILFICNNMRIGGLGVYLDYIIESMNVLIKQSRILYNPIIATDCLTDKDHFCYKCTGLIVKFNEVTLTGVINSLLIEINLQLKIQNYQKQYCKGNANEIRKFHSIIGHGVE